VASRAADAACVARSASRAAPEAARWLLPAVVGLPSSVGLRVVTRLPAVRVAALGSAASPAGSAV
jgi:hypothetical protein